MSGHGSHLFREYCSDEQIGLYALIYIFHQICFHLVSIANLYEDSTPKVSQYLVERTVDTPGYVWEEMFLLPTNYRAIEIFLYKKP